MTVPYFFHSFFFFFSDATSHLLWTELNLILHLVLFCCVVDVWRRWGVCLLFDEYRQLMQHSFNAYVCCTDVVVPDFFPLSFFGVWSLLDLNLEPLTSPPIPLPLEPQGWRCGFNAHVCCLEAVLRFFFLPFFMGLVPAGLETWTSHIPTPAPYHLKLKGEVVVSVIYNTVVIILALSHYLCLL